MNVRFLNGIAQFFLFMCIKNLISLFFSLSLLIQQSIKRLAIDLLNFVFTRSVQLSRQMLN